MSSSSNSSLPENTKPEDREEEDKAREAGVEAAIALLNGDINTRLQGVDPALQSDVDKILMYKRMNWLYEAYVHYLAEIDFLIVYDRFAWFVHI